MSKQEEMQKHLRQSLYTLDLPPQERQKAQEIIDSPKPSSAGIAAKAEAQEPASTVIYPPASNAVTAPALKNLPVKTNQTSSNAASTSEEFLYRVETKLRADQLEALNSFELKLARRANRKQRLTKADVIRVLVDLTPYLDVDVSAIPDEATLKQKIFKCFGVRVSQASAKITPNA